MCGIEIHFQDLAFNPTISLFIRLTLFCLLSSSLLLHPSSSRKQPQLLIWWFTEIQLNVVITPVVTQQPRSPDSLTQLLHVIVKQHGGLDKYIFIHFSSPPPQFFLCSLACILICCLFHLLPTYIRRWEQFPTDVGFMFCSLVGWF